MLKPAIKITYFSAEKWCKLHYQTLESSLLCRMGCKGILRSCGNCYHFPAHSAHQGSWLTEHWTVTHRYSLSSDGCIE